MKKNEGAFTKLHLAQLQSLYSGEIQLGQTLPQMTVAATARSLKKTLKETLKETQEGTHRNIQRLKSIFTKESSCPESKPSLVMQQLIDEAKAIIYEPTYGPEVIDVGLIAALQRIALYQMSGYGTAKHFAEMLGYPEAAFLLFRICDAAKVLDQKLNFLARHEINQKAVDAYEGEDETREEFLQGTEYISFDTPIRNKVERRA